MSPVCSLIVSAYNQAPQLDRVLETVAAQSVQGFELLIADDGSSDATAEIVRAFARRHPRLMVRHVWQEDEGFRKTRILNQAFREASSEYLVIVDGDMLLQPGFLASHLAWRRPERVLCGYRGVKLGTALTERLLGGDVSLRCDFWSLLRASWRGELQRPGRGLRIGRPWLRYLLVPARADLSGCNFSLYRQDLWAVNGMDETIQDYGFEDYELGWRLKRNGCQLLNVSKWANTCHLHHATRQPAPEARMIRAHIVAADSRYCAQGLEWREGGSGIADYR